MLFGMGRIQFAHTYNSIISLENLLLAWKEFSLGKQKKKDVQIFQLRLLRNISDLQEDLQNKRYRHGGYEAFEIRDPKPRDIHKASVRDRVLHHATYRVLYPFLDKKFIADSYSCRIGKGTHKAMNRFRSFAYRVSKNHTRTAWILKCDIRKFFANIDHAILKNILVKHGLDSDTLWLLSCVIDSFHSGTVGLGRAGPGQAGKGLPLGNLTSQLLVNIYMNEFDQFVKHTIKARYYIRYADDFVLYNPDLSAIHVALKKIQRFLNDHLKLQLHPDKVFIKTIASGIDYLGWVHFPDHRVLRTTTKRRMMRRISMTNMPSYEGLLRHGNTMKVRVKCLELTASSL